MDRHDSGFTLVELLIVIVVLGVLSSVSVFAVRGITSRGEIEGCSADLDVLIKAQESHETLFGGYADAPTLVAAGLLASESVRYDVAADADGYTLTPAADSPCTDTAGTSTAAPPPTAPAPAPRPSAGGSPPGTAEDASYQSGVEAWHWWATIETNSSRPAKEVLVFGRQQAADQFAAMVAAEPPTTRRVTLLDLDTIPDSRKIDDILRQARSTGATTLVLYAADDTGMLSDTNQSVAAYLSAAATPNPYIQLGLGGDLVTEVTSIG